MKLTRVILGSGDARNPSVAAMKAVEELNKEVDNYDEAKILQIQSSVVNESPVRSADAEYYYQYIITALVEYDG